MLGQAARGKEAKGEPATGLCARGLPRPREQGVGKARHCGPCSHCILALNQLVQHAQGEACPHALKPLTGAESIRAYRLKLELKQ